MIFCRITSKCIVILLCIFSSCNSSRVFTSDKNSNNAAKGLLERLKNTKEGFMVGYEDALAYGVDWKAEKNMCDMYRTSGEYPAIYGWDLGDVHTARNLDNVSFVNMLVWIRQVHQSGGINTISFHMDEPISGESSWTKVKIMKDILPGGKHHDKIKTHLDHAAKFLKNCKIGDDYIPIIFRPWHEHNGDWFWWGKGNADEQDYIKLYQFTADYFKKEHNIHHLLYAFSPDRSRIKNIEDKSEYLYGYPGDDYVDLIGLDNYWDVKQSGEKNTDEKSIKSFVRSLEVLSDVAEERGKIAALTETGLESINNDKWFTERILNPIKSSEKAQKIKYILFWRNNDTKHHFMAYPEHTVKDDFNVFIKDPLTLTLKDIGKDLEQTFTLIK